MILNKLLKIIGSSNMIYDTDLKNIQYFQNTEKEHIFYAKYNAHKFTYRGKEWEFIDECLDKDAHRYLNEILFKRSKSDIVQEDDLNKNKVPLLNKNWADEKINELLPTGKNNLTISLNDKNNYFQYLNKNTIFFVKYGRFLFSFSEDDKEWKYVNSVTKSQKFLDDLYLNRIRTTEDLIKNQVPLMKKLSEKYLKKMKIPVPKNETISKILIEVL
jgi:hypothetical protein